MIINCVCSFDMRGGRFSFAEPLVQNVCCVGRVILLWVWFYSSCYVAGVAMYLAYYGIFTCLLFVLCMVLIDCVLCMVLIDCVCLCVHSACARGFLFAEPPA